jgi:phosphohistidine phosphatase
MNKSKILHIARHAKSSWDYKNVSDFDRPLKERGIHDAHEMAGKMKMKHPLPELIITSPANRAFHTALIFSRVIELPFNQFHIDPDIYGSDVDGLFQKIKSLDDKYCCVMIFGHNPEFSDLVNFLTGDSVDEVPTCGVMSIFYDTEKWQEISRGKVIKVNFDYPKKKMEV